MDGVEKDFPKFLALQARMAGEIGVQVMHEMLVYYAPTPAGRHMAEAPYRTWKGLGSPAVAIIEDEAEALAIVGCRERHIVDLAAEVTGR